MNGRLVTAKFLKPGLSESFVHQSVFVFQSIRRLIMVPST
jgi:hypothetical protein